MNLNWIWIWVIISLLSECNRKAQKNEPRWICYYFLPQIYIQHMIFGSTVRQHKQNFISKSGSQLDWSQQLCSLCKCALNKHSPLWNCWNFFIRLLVQTSSVLSALRVPSSLSVSVGLFLNDTCCHAINTAEWAIEWAGLPRA